MGLNIPYPCNFLSHKFRLQISRKLKYRGHFLSVTGEEVWQLRTDPDYQLQISVPSETRPRAHFASTEVLF